MLADGNGLLDEVVQVLGELRSAALLFEDAVDLLLSKEPDLGHAVLIPEDDADLAFGEPLLGVLDDEVDDVGGLKRVVLGHLPQVRER